MFTGNHNAKLKWVHDEHCFQFDMSLLGLLTLYLGANFFTPPLVCFFLIVDTFKNVCSILIWTIASPI
jgi:hypothetical protein